MLLKVTFLLAVVFQALTSPLKSGFEMNPPDLYEGDIVLTSEQAKLVDEIEKGIRTSTVLTDVTRRWPMNIDGYVVVPIEYDAASGYCKEKLSGLFRYNLKV